MDEEEFKDLQESLEMDYQLGQDLKDRVSVFRFLPRCWCLPIHHLGHPSCYRLLHWESIGVGR